MELVKSKQSSPNQRLSEAIARFAREMPSEEQERLRGYNSRGLGVADVMSLTAEVDHLATTRITQVRRCYGPRISSFLDGIQEFAKVADLAVGAAKSTAATGVWTAVRFLLLAGTQASNPYIDKLSGLFLTLGRSAHRFRDMSILFPRSQPLQHAVFEYYIVVVDMCCEILKLSKKSNLARYWTAFAEETYTAKLDQCAKQIMQEIGYENSRILQEESRRNAIFRSRSEHYMELQKHHQQRLLRKELLDACSKHDYKTTWKQTRALGTTSLFNDSPAYQEWMRSRKSLNLIYHGKLGSGKSVLLASMVGDLFMVQNPPVLVTYFFCRHDLPDSLLPRTIFGCIARQLLQNRADLQDLASSVGLDSYLNVEDLVELIKKFTLLPIHLILDGLDNCQPEHRNEILVKMKQLQKDIVLNICISTRDVNAWLQSAMSESQNFLTSGLPADNPDIDTYIEQEIGERLTTKKLHIQSPSLIAKVKSTLKSKADGMFLWVHLQIIYLCLMESDYDIEEALESLPSDLLKTYARLLQHQPSSRYRNQLFQLVIGARQPLTTHQLREALSVQPGDIKFDPTKVLNSIDRVIASSGGLLIVDEEEDTVRLVHHSVAGFLVSSDHEQPIDQELASANMTYVVLTYLNYSLLETQLTVRKSPTLHAAAIPGAILTSVLPGGRHIIKLSQARDVDRNLVEYGRPGLTTQKVFLRYATSNWLDHVMEIPLDTDYMGLLRNALSKGRIRLPKVYQQGSPLCDAVRADRLDLVLVFIGQTLSQVDRELALNLAVGADRNADLVDILVKENKLAQDAILLKAMARGSSLLFQAMVKNYPNITAKSLNKSYRTLSYLTPLGYAIFRSRKIGYHLVKVMLEDDRIDPRKLVDGISTPMALAVSCDAPEIVKLLSAHYLHLKNDEQLNIWNMVLRIMPRPKAEWDWPETDGEEILEILLKTGCLKLDCLPESGRLVSPLMQACERGLYHMVKIMLEFDSRDINMCSQLDRISPTTNSRVKCAHTAWDLAVSPELKELLERYGGKGFEALQAEDTLPCSASQNST